MPSTKYMYGALHSPPQTRQPHNINHLQL